VFFLENDPLQIKLSKFCSKRFYRLTNRCVVFKFLEIWPAGNRWNRVLFTWQKKQNFAWLSSYRYCADCIQNLPRSAPDNVHKECSRFHPNWFTFDRVTAERTNIAKTRRKVNPIFG